MDLDLQIIDLQVQKLVEKFTARLESELKIKNDADKARSACFVLLVAKTVLELEDEEAFDCLVEGGNDCGIDAVYVDDIVDGTFVTTLFQGKYAKRDDGGEGFKMAGIEKMIGAVSSVFDPGVQMPANERLEARLAEIRSLVADGNLPKVRVILCNNGKTWEANGQQLITNTGWTQVKWDHVNHHALVKAQQATETVKETLTLTGKSLLENFEFRRVLIGKMRLMELAALFNRHVDEGDRLLERNVRRYLGLTGNPVNEGIRQTLLDVADRENFYFYNNGITFTCTKFGHSEFQHMTDLSVQVEGLQVINGGQTCKTVQRVIGELAGADQPTNAAVLVRLYELPADEPDLVVRITEATNSQSPVDFRDRKANDAIQQKLELGLTELGYTYRRKRSAESMKEKEITSLQAAEAVFAAVREMPHLIRYRTHQLFQLRYVEIFTADLSPAEVVVSATLLRYAEAQRKQAADDAPRFVPYASTFITMLMYRAIRAELNPAADRLTHQNFAAAMGLWELHQERYYQAAVDAITAALTARQLPADASFQKLSAEFRRADLLEKLNNPEGTE